MKRGKKKLWLLLGGGILVCVLVLVFAMGGSSEEVNVYSFSYLGMTEFWGDSQESYGPVTTDKIQTVFLSDTQTVTELLVKEGDAVKKGDLLMTFDTTLSELQLERKRLEWEKEKLQLEQENNRLKELFNTVPWEPPEETMPTEPYAGVPLSGTWKLADSDFRDGTTQDTAVVCWLQNGITVDAQLLSDIYDEIISTPQRPAGSSPSQIPEIPLSEGILLDGTVTSVQPQNETGGEDAGTQGGSESGDSTQTESERETETQTEKETEQETSEETQQETTRETQQETTKETQQETTKETQQETTKETQQETTKETQQETTKETQKETTSSTEPSETTSPTVPDYTEGDFYIIFRTSQDNMSNKEVLTWEGLYVKVLTNGFSFQFFPAPYYQELDPFYIPTEDTSESLDFGSGYTSADLQKMINEQRKAISDQEFKVRVSENAYRIMERELADGNIYAEIDGTIVSLLDEEESKMNKQPFLKLSGGGGFLIKGSVSELAKDSLKIGQEVTVNDWNTGGSYVGTIQEIGDFPSQQRGWNGMGNPTATYYPFTVFVDESADLQAGIYASIQYSSGEDTHGIYLENPFLRTEDGESYVLVRGPGGRLEKRTVTTGKTLWGSYTEILSGVTEEDYLAFPYGKEARPGAKTREGSLEELYNY